MSEEKENLEKIRERMASLEAANAFHRDALDDIGKTLKEVVKTQHILANQKEEITKLTDAQEIMRQKIHDHENEMVSIKMKIATLELDSEASKGKIAEVETQVSDNSHFTKTATKIAGAFLVPIALAILLDAMGVL